MIWGLGCLSRFSVLLSSTLVRRLVKKEEPGPFHLLMTELTQICRASDKVELDRRPMVLRFKAWLQELAARIDR